VKIMGASVIHKDDRADKVETVNRRNIDFNFRKSEVLSFHINISLLEKERLSLKLEFERSIWI